MFIPFRHTGVLFKPTGNDVYGQRQYETQGVLFGWAPIHNRSYAAKTSVRADTSGTKSRAEQLTDEVRIIVSKVVTPNNDDKITIDGKPLRIVRVQERMDIAGRLHHWEVDCVKTD